MKYDFTIIGAGIVGLATAVRILEKKKDARILVLEKEDRVAAHQTGHNSGVIHSGIYYKPGSLKAKNCIRGYHMLLDFCKKEEIPFELCGKVIVATNNTQIPILQNIYKRGIENGLDGLKVIGKEEINEIEPYVNGVKGIFVPQTGIINYTLVCKTYENVIRNAGSEIKFLNKVKDIELVKSEIIVKTNAGDYNTNVLINCAGLYSDKVAKLTHPELEIKIIPFRGEYYELAENSRHLVNNLIYPVPDPNFPFLGVHFTRMIDGKVEAGPNAVFAFKREGYKLSDIDLSELFESLTWPGFQKVMFKYWKTGIGELYRSFSKAAFTKALQGLIPEIMESDLLPGGAGVRAQACDRTGGLLDDFAILEKDKVVNVVNAPSPAATSSLSIGETVAEMALAKL